MLLVQKVTKWIGIEMHIGKWINDFKKAITNACIEVGEIVLVV